MADTLGVIAGDVRLDVTNFRQGVSTINRQLQMVRTYFDSSAARARAFGDATDQLRIRSQSISRQIDLQRRKVQLLGRAHQEYTRRLGADAAATQRLAIQLNRARAVMTQMEATQRQVNAEMNRTNQAQERYARAMTRLEQRTRLAQSQMRLAEANARAFGSETDRLRVRQQNLTRQIDLQRQQVTLLSLAYRESAQRMGRNAEETRRAAIQLNQARAALAGMQGDLNRLNRQLNQAGALWNRVAGSMRNLRWMAFQASVGLSVFGGSLAVALGSAVKQAIDFEDAFAGVRKTVDATESQFAALNEGIRDMARTMPQSHEEIARVAEVAGQLGIKQQDLLKFTRTMVDMGVATTMSSDEAATALARLANITQMPMDQIDRLGATVVHLGNNLAATEEEIVEMGLRIAGAGHQVGMAEAEILAFAGALSAVGIKAEAGGTAISRVMLQMNTDVQEGGKNLQLFAKVAGMSASQFEKTFKKDAAGAIIAFIEGLGKMKKEGKNVVPVLKELSLNEIRVRDALLRASGAGDLFRRSIQMGNKAWKENSALTKEAQERYKTAASQMKIFRNRINDIKITLGNALIPVLLRALKALEPVVNGVKGAAEWFERLSPITKNAIGIFAGVTAGLLALGTAIAGIVAIANPVSAAIVGISVGVGTLSASVYKSSREMTKAREDALRYGEGVSEGAKKAAKGFMELRDQASVNLAKLRIATGAEAKRIVDETVAIFAQMGDKITAALNKDRLGIQKAAASLLGEVPKELEGAVAEVTDTAIRAIDSQIKRIEEANKVIRKGLVEFGGDIEKMPEDFAKRYTQALKDVDQGAQAFAKRIQDLSAMTERIQADQGKVTAKGAIQWVKEIEDSYKRAEKAAKNWANSQRETWESAFASGKITRDQYQMITDIIDAEEKKRIDIAKKRRQEALEVLRDSLSEEAYLYDVHTGKVLESQSNLLGKNEYLLKQRGKEAWGAYFDSMINEGKKADPEKHFAGLIKKYGDIGTKSVEEMAKGMKQSQPAVKKAAQDNKKTVEKELAQTSDGGGGKKAANEFSKGIAGGRASARKNAKAVSEAAKNNLKIPGVQSLGLAVAQGFARGIRNGSGIAGAAARALANAALNKMRSTLMIRSPSRKMMEIGMYTAEGFELGMKKRLAQVQAAANMLAETVQPTTMGVSEARPVQPAGGSVSVVNNYHLTVTGQTDPWGSSRELMRHLRNLELLSINR